MSRHALIRGDDACISEDAFFSAAVAITSARRARTPATPRTWRVPVGEQDAREAVTPSASMAPELGDVRGLALAESTSARGRARRGTCWCPRVNAEGFIPTTHDEGRGARRGQRGEAPRGGPAKVDATNESTDSPRRRT